MDERRNLRRRHLRYYLHVHDRGTGEFVGRLADITVGGVMLVTEDELIIGNRYELRIDFRNVLVGKRHLLLSARCVWCEKDTINPAYFASGFELDDLSAEDSEVIKALIVEYGLRMYREDENGD